ncbi:type II toxin-antitoxin system HicA family toxin [Nodularia sp. NIES-3585]|nr:YcfA family protein [Nodularia sp. NIES-3585]
MPKKIKELKSLLKKAGFVDPSAKGSHTHWYYPLQLFPII